MPVNIILSVEVKDPGKIGFHKQPKKQNIGCNWGVISLELSAITSVL